MHFVGLVQKRSMGSCGKEVERRERWDCTVVSFLEGRWGVKGDTIGAAMERRVLACTSTAGFAE